MLLLRLSPSIRVASLLRRCSACCLLAASLPWVPLSSFAEDKEGDAPATMMGRQSNNTGIRGVPAPGSVCIDGDLKDWDFSGRIWSFADIAIRDRYSTETAVMWDKDHLYLAAKFRDPNPLINTINPAFDPESGWKGDAFQLRVLTDRPIWITLWQYSAERRSVMHLSRWKDENSPKEQEVTLLMSQPGAKELGQGVEMAFKKDAEGHGYVQEVKIPWKLLYLPGATPEAKAGLTFRMGLELFWGRPEESTWPVHRYADNLQPGETSREFFWTAKKAWGDVKLQDGGNMPPLKYILAVEKVEGSIPVRCAIPAGAKEFTVVIDSKDGRRIRNLGAQLDPELYTVSSAHGRRTVEVLWDGRDDQGRMVTPDSYVVRGLTHQGLGADYLMSFFNPGTPPWEAGGKGGWGADHGCPTHVAAAGDWTVVGWPFAEGGSGIVGIGPDGKKKWGEKRGVKALAADDQYVYFISSSWHASGNLCRLDKTKGTYKPFVKEGKELPFELPLAQVLGSEESTNGTVVALASSGTRLALALSGNKIAFVDRDSAALLKLVEVSAPTAVAFSPQERCYAVSDGRVVEVEVDSGSLRALPTPGLNLSKGHADKTNNGEDDHAPATRATLAVDCDGAVGAYDVVGQQVKFYSPEGSFLYAVGVKGGRPDRGKFNEQAMSHVSSVAVNQQGETWVTESWEHPRRVSVWGRDGRLIRDYVGNTGYAGTGAYLHDEDPTLAYYGPVEMKLDYATRTWKVTQVLWVPGEGEHFPIATSSHTHPHRFSSQAGGKLRQYLFAPPYRTHGSNVIYMEGEHGWRPVAAIGALGVISGKLDSKGVVVAQPEGPYAGRNAYDGYFWNDENADGRVQFEEVTIVPHPKPVALGKSGSPALPLGNGWGARMAPEDLSFFTNGVTRWVPLRYTEEGAPVYGPASARSYATQGNGDFVPLLQEKSVLALMNRGYDATTGVHALDADSGVERWSYPNPYPSVHGSHRAPMPRPGLLIGPLKILGTASLPSEEGSVFAMRGNLGQDFYMTSDGLFVGTVFQDGRLPTMALPERESDLVGAPMESYGGGVEPFSGWFGRHQDGKVRFTNGLAGQAAMVYELKGLDGVKRFTAPSVTVSDAQLAQAARENDERRARKLTASEKKEVVARLPQPPALDGKGGGWRGVKSFVIQSPASSYEGRAQLAYDDTHLYLAMEVEDPTPWKNEGSNAYRLFKTGDAVDLQLGPAGKRTAPVAGDFRVVFSLLDGKPAAVLMRPVSPGAPADVQRLYTSPVGEKRFDEVRVLPTARVVVQVKPPGYRLEAALPLAEVGLKPTPGGEIRGDAGFISSDASGRINTARTYWANPATNLVADEPLEAWLTPAAWGTLQWEP